MNDGIDFFSPYLEKVLKFINSGNTLKIVFVGIDRYPKNFSSIPFCKNRWEYFNKGTAGTVILKALGFLNLPTIGQPTDFFENTLLKENHVAFINLSYSFRHGKLNSSNLVEINEHYSKYNKLIISNSKNVILCGKMAQKYFYKIIAPNEKHDGVLDFCHPSARLFNDKIREKHKMDWGENNVLKKMI